ncbi:MAG TPA: alpha/beta fold hydrolase, partial [Dehalococcoidia bacterium]
IDIINTLQSRARNDGIATSLIVSVSAVFGAEQPQTSMEHWVEAEVRSRLDGLPCQRVVLIGHSHGGATVTSVTAALDARYAPRMLGVLIDRTIALYDRPATEMPSRTQLLNFFQVNEGWHGERIDAPNVANFDETTERAPVAPSDGGGGLAIVSHKTLDDSRGVQQRIVDGVMTWVQG